MANHAIAARRYSVTHRRNRGRAHPIAFVIDRFLALPLGVAIALIWANIAPQPYFVVAHTLSFAVNDIGMAFFFGLITQEIVEAVMPGGALHSWRRWSLPIVGAAGGLAMATAVYLGYVHSHYETILAAAWPIAGAVDIAASYYLLKTLLPRSGAVPFVLLLGIVTNLFGMLVVAGLHPTATVYGGGVMLIVPAIAIAAAMRALRIRAFWPYIVICGPLSWLAFAADGVQPAFALVPIVPFLPHEPRSIDLLADPPDDDAVHHFEHEWNTLVQAILFLFGLVNGGVILRGYDTGTWALLLAALAGRPLGIVAAVLVASAAGLKLPGRLGWRQLVVTAFAASSGFTFALFFATAVLSTGPMLAQLTLGALGTSAGVLLAVASAWLLRVGRFAR